MSTCYYRQNATRRFSGHVAQCLIVVMPTLLTFHQTAYLSSDLSFLSRNSFQNAYKFCKLFIRSEVSSLSPIPNLKVHDIGNDENSL